MLPLLSLPGMTGYFWVMGVCLASLFKFSAKSKHQLLAPHSSTIQCQEPSIPR